MQLRPDGISWPSTAAEVALRGSATDLWDKIYPATLEGIVGPEQVALDQTTATWTQWPPATTST